MKEKRNNDAKGIITGVEVVNSKEGKETLNLSLDSQKYKKLQEKQEKNRRRAARKQAVDNTKKSIKNKIQGAHAPCMFIRFYLC